MEYMVEKKKRRKSQIQITPDERARLRTFFLDLAPGTVVMAALQTPVLDTPPNAKTGAAVAVISNGVEKPFPCYICGLPASEYNGITEHWFCSQDYKYILKHRERIQEQIRNEQHMCYTCHQPGENYMFSIGQWFCRPHFLEYSSRIKTPAGRCYHTSTENSPDGNQCPLLATHYSFSQHRGYCLEHFEQVITRQEQKEKDDIRV